MGIHKFNIMKNKTEIKAYGLRLLLPGNKKIKNLRKKFKPSNHGDKVWNSNWLLINYLEQINLTSSHRILEIGCGWGLSGIYCAKKHSASVTCVDSDGDVYPFLALNAKTNNVHVNFLNLGFDKIKSTLLRNTDIIIASDICFCDSLIDSLRRLIQRAKMSSVGMVLIADPGRWPFDDLAELFINKRGTELLAWDVKKPICASGKILKIQLNT